jgi:hypothetical protein
MISAVVMTLKTIEAGKDHAGVALHFLALTGTASDIAPEFEM